MHPWILLYRYKSSICGVQWISGVHLSCSVDIFTLQWIFPCVITERWSKIVHLERSSCSLILRCCSWQWCYKKKHLRSWTRTRTVLTCHHFVCFWAVIHGETRLTRNNAEMLGGFMWLVSGFTHQSVSIGHVTTTAFMKKLYKLLLKLHRQLCKIW